MVRVRYSILLALIVTIKATTNEREPRSLKKIIDFIKPYVFDSIVVVANNSLENGAEKGFDAEIDNRDSFIHEYHVTDESYAGDDTDGKFFLKKKKKKKKKNKKKKKKKKKPSQDKPETTEKPEYKPGTSSKPSVDKIDEPTEEEIELFYEVNPLENEEFSLMGVHETKPQKYEMNPVDEEIKLSKFPKFPKLPNFAPKRKIILFTSTVVVYATSVNTIYPSCLEMRNVHSVCEENKITVTPTHMLQSGHTRRPGSVSVTDDDQDEDGGLKTLIQPSKTNFGVETTKPASFDVEQTGNFDVVSSSIEEREHDHTRTFTPGLDNVNDENNSSELKNVLYFLKPKIEFTTEFLHLTTTQDIYDFSQTATVLAVNCLPPDLKLPLCPSSEKFTGQKNPVETHHSNVIQIIKAQDQMPSSTLSNEDLSYVSSMVPQIVLSQEKHNVSTNESILLGDSLKRIQRMIFQYVIDKWKDRNSGKFFFAPTERM